MHTHDISQTTHLIGVGVSWFLTAFTVLQFGKDATTWQLQALLPACDAELLCTRPLKYAQPEKRTRQKVQAPVLTGGGACLILRSASMWVSFSSEMKLSAQF